MDTKELDDDLDKISGQFFALVRRFARCMKKVDQRRFVCEDLLDEQDLTDDEVPTKDLLRNKECELDSAVSQMPTFPWKDNEGKDVKFLGQSDVAKDECVVQAKE